MSIVAVDLGKTGCRVRATSGTTVSSAAGAGVPGLADAEGDARAFTAIVAALGELPAGMRGNVSSMGVGAAGAEAAPAAAQALAERVAAHVEAPVAVTSDAVTAHAGAFAGTPGTIVIVGTGTVLLTLDGAGALSQVDGWGPWLGDEGSGRAIGQEGLRAVLAAHDGRGPATALTAAALELHAPLSTLPRWVADTAAPARQLARFAPFVLEAAASGDAVARGIVDRGVEAVVTACSAASSPYCLLGGIAGSGVFGDALRARLRDRGLAVAEPFGDALAGAEYIARTPGSVYERNVVRHG
ncbi:N-acetylglucosamine kinase [Microbacterium sp. NPDC056736]|uniref:N-acetylglucosamine kinase n=1 Tax=Microbacterium sp. NPDC056736 TaxID=3345932 RepID=UPI00366E118F